MHLQLAMQVWDKKQSLCQLLLHGSWRNATNMYMGSYELFVMSNSYIISEIMMGHQAFLRKTKMQEDAMMPTATW